ncbi:alpha/beta hydrolase [Flavilitoribacter nigricans]|uniref:Pectin acetylesterase n=1 Tax=Flavilitoribacter nigricans (strain ATCC 23147 / DSM 23189 / NBRC 102662 / NCIMB 1420 / SS-2) TaxID=1122177 RepID=A0A2D0N3S3_FLAN2|nr:alpha/beta hydrolase [Flavilitoribacter nigricans]PHN02799.1 pectin acetylesterase [Flavilitoribacter nigricans DSM 23189 = NBRC 102662]
MNKCQLSGLLSAILLLSVWSSHAQEYIPLWPDGKMPNSKGLAVQDTIVRERFQQVGEPGMYALFPSSDENNGSAVLIIPGGGYHHVTYNFSGLQLAKWLNTLGISTFVLKYRLPHSPDLKVRHEGPIQDAERAMQLIRAHAEEWGIDKERIGVQGTSAGGHLAAVLGTEPQDLADIGDEVSRESYAPNFLILVSPVISFVDSPHRGSQRNFLGPEPAAGLIDTYSAEKRVSERTPPAFLVHAANDTSVDPMNSLLFTQALMEHDVSVSFHLFPTGKHAIAMRNNPGATDLWTAICEAWMKEKGFIRLVSKQ